MLGGPPQIQHSLTCIHTTANALLVTDGSLWSQTSLLWRQSTQPIRGHTSCQCHYRSLPSASPYCTFLCYSRTRGSRHSNLGWLWRIQVDTIYRVLLL